LSAAAPVDPVDPVDPDPVDPVTAPFDTVPPGWLAMVPLAGVELGGDELCGAGLVLAGLVLAGLVLAGLVLAGLDGDVAADLGLAVAGGLELVLLQGVSVAWGAVALGFFGPDALVLAFAEAVAVALLVAVALELEVAGAVLLAVALWLGLALSLAGLPLVLAPSGLVPETSGATLGVTDLAVCFEADREAVGEHPGASAIAPMELYP
jgi:hypothetical protein